MASRPSERPIVVYGALLANAAIAVTKFLAAAASGSAALLAEGVHSIVDMGDQALLLLGLHRSRRPPDDTHPYGYGKELYFWGLIVAIVIFAAGGGVSALMGLSHIYHPRPLEDPTWSYVVLALAAVFESISFAVAYRQFSFGRGARPFWEALRASKDVVTYTVLVEDGAALIGLAIAFVGVAASHALGAPWIDGLASLLIGVLLAVVAVFLAYEARSLLVGESAGPEVADDIQRLAREDPAVVRVARPLTMQLGPEQILVTLDVEFRSEISAADVVAAVDRLEHRIRALHPEVKSVFIEAEALRPPGRGRPAESACNR